MFDYNQDVKMTIRNCINDKDLLDVHINHLGLINEKKDLIVYCRVCHYNIDHLKFKYDKGYI